MRRGTWRPGVSRGYKVYGGSPRYSAHGGEAGVHYEQSSGKFDTDVNTPRASAWKIEPRGSHCLLGLLGTNVQTCTGHVCFDSSPDYTEIVTLYHQYLM